MAPCEAATAEIGSSELAAELASRDGTAFPFAGSLDVTARCNLRCAHCYVDACSLAGRGERSAEATCLLLDWLADAGVLALVLTGGEPLLYHDFPRIYRHAKRCGFVLTLFTNATRVDRDVLDLLSRWPPRRVEVSVYGATAGVYEAVTRVPGSYDRFLEGVAGLRRLGLPLRLKYLVTKRNVHELDAARRRAASLGLPLRADAVLAPGVDGDRNTLRERVDVSSLAPRMPTRTGRPSGPRRHHRLFTCGAGLRTFHADAEGQLHPCVLWRHDPFEPSGRTPTDWLRHVAVLRERKLPPGSACRGCMVRRSCPVCPALSRGETGEAGKEVAYFCDWMATGDRPLPVGPDEACGRQDFVV
jgi:MoaA/NifB/PqqE/SkfB family radical SAM enzyme